MTPFSAERLLELGRRWTQGLWHLLYPNVCVVCHAPLLADQEPFCVPCRRALTTDRHPACPRCGGTLGPYTHLDHGCRACRDLPLHFDRVVRLGLYDGLLRDVVLRLKHAGNEGIAELVARLWAECAAETLRGLRADVVIPVPLHWRR